MEECIMKRLLSIVLLLVFAMTLVPMSVSAEGDATGTPAAQWTAQNFENLAETADGFTIAAGGTTAREVALWNGLLYEGKFSVEIKTSAINGGSGEMPGIFFGGKNLDKITASNVTAGASYYRAYFDGNGAKLVVGAVDNGVWVSGLGTGRNVDLKAKLGDQWATVFSADSVKLMVAFSMSGAARFWINDIEVLSVANTTDTFKVNDNLTVRKDCVPYGGQIAYDNGSADVAGGASKMTVEGGLELKVITGEVTYDANSYTLTAKGNKVLAYFANREITDGSVKTSFPVTASSQAGILVGLKDDGATMWEGTKIAYYMLQLRSTNQFRWTLSDGASVTDEIFNAEDNATKKALAETYIAGRIPGYKFSANANETPCNWFFGGNKAISDLNNIVASFNIGKDSAVIDSSAINASVGSFVDSQPFGGGFYGIRSDKDMEVTFYAINNKAEAIGLDLVSATTESLKVGDTGSITVKTFPAGAVINSGKALSIVSEGVEQIGDAVLNEDGTYTINYKVNSADADAVEVAVDNHIFGTLSAEADITVEAGGNTGNEGNTGNDGNTGNEGGDNTGNTGDNTDNGNTGDNTDNGATDDGKKDDGKNNSIVWIVVAVAAVAVIAVVIVIIAKKKK